MVIRMGAPLPLLPLLALAAAPGLALARERGRDPPPQEPPQERPGEHTGERPVERLEKWPRLRDKERVSLNVQKLRRAETDEMERQAREALLADGAMVAPTLLKVLERERDEDVAERIVGVLDGIVGAPHTRLLAPYFANRALAVRTWSLRRAAVHADPGLREAAAGAWTRVLKKKDKADAEDRYAAALCLVSTGDTVGMDALVERARTGWKNHKRELRAVMEAVRGDAATDPVLAHLRSGDRKTKSAALRLLAGCGTEQALRALRPYLESTDNTLRVDAINACRGIVDGEGPLEKLPVFEAIELAKRWRERIR